MRLTPESLRAQKRMKDGIKIHIREIEQILPDIAGHRIVGAIRAGHRVDERGHAHLDHFKEWLFDGIFS